MKITSAGPAGRSSKVKAKAARAPAKGAFKDHLVSETTGAAPAAGPGAVAPVDALLALQEAGESPSGRAQALARGKKLLDHLDEIRLGLLTGRFSKNRLQALAEMVSKQRAAVDDPALKAILDDIELRAAVELAKLERETGLDL